MLLLLLLPALVGATTQSPSTQAPIFLPAAAGNKYIYSSRAQASKACAHIDKVLCSKSQLVNHSMCEAGWCSDWEGYWMGSPCPAGCGSAGYNDWSGSAGAYCCSPPPPPPPPGSPGKPRVVGWYDTSEQYMSGFPIEDIDFSVVTHIVAGSGVVEANGTVSCNPAQQYADPVYAKLYHAVRANGAKLQWSYSTPPADILTNATNRENFLATVRDAVLACDVDGIEFDYEGPPTAQAADDFTTLLIDIKQAVCRGNSSCGFVISCDSEPPQWNDYHRLNASKMDGKNIDFVNYMCYFDATPDSDVSRWNESISMLLDQGYPASTINIAIPYYTPSGAAWADLCHECPDLAPDKNSCAGDPIVGKRMNERIGALAVTRGIGGLFPWMLNYDSSGSTGGCTDNSLFQWLRQGMITAPGNTFSPPPPPSASTS